MDPNVNQPNPNLAGQSDTAAGGQANSQPVPQANMQAGQVAADNTQVDVTSAPAQPVQQVQDPNQPQANPALANTGPAQTDGPAKILLAEDEEDARIIYIDILTNAGFAADAAVDGKSTLDKLAGKVYDLLLLDIIMPDMDGISVLSEIKKYPAKYGTPKVVMLTNIGGDLAIEKALNIGANGYMLKSETEPDELVNIIKKYLAGENFVKSQNKLI